MKELYLNIIVVKNDTKTPPKLNMVHYCASEDVHMYIGNILSTITIIMIREVTVTRTPSEMHMEVMMLPNSVHIIDSSMMNTQIPSSTPFWLM